MCHVRVYVTVVLAMCHQNPPLNHFMHAHDTRMHDRGVPPHTVSTTRSPTVGHRSRGCTS
jgi:hypothetical protein